MTDLLVECQFEASVLVIAPVPESPLLGHPPFITSLLLSPGSTPVNLNQHTRFVHERFQRVISRLPNTLRSLILAWHLASTSYLTRSMACSELCVNCTTMILLFGNV